MANRLECPNALKRARTESGRGKNRMKFASIALIGAALVLSNKLNAADPKPLTSPKEKASYGIGMNVGKRFKHEFIDLDIESFVRGVKDALAAAKPALTEEELAEAMNTMRKDVEAKATVQADKNKKEGSEFLAKNKSQKDVKSTESGLQYIVLKEGTGPNPKPTDVVKVHYRGTFIDGTEFDNSYERGEPAKFPVNQVIKGWGEALPLMKVGGKSKLFIPADLAYGEASQPPIPPNSVLIFEVELLAIEDAKQ
jgi:FKBP-type peptidyl-prolyl cis-trans isomerase